MNMNMPKIAQHLAHCLEGQHFQLPGTDATSVLDLLYLTYTDNLGRDPEEIERGFLALGEHLESLPLDENNAIFAIVCELCNAYEKRAFMDAIKLGAYFILELQEK